MEAGYQRIKELWSPIMDVYDECGVKLALEGQHQDKIVVVRMEGTNKDTGLAIIDSIKDVDIVSVPGLRECVKALADRRDRL